MIDRYNSDNEPYEELKSAYEDDCEAYKLAYTTVPLTSTEKLQLYKNDLNPWVILLDLGGWDIR